MIILRPKTWKIKPPAGAVLDRNNPLTRGLDIAFFFLERGGNTVRNLVDNKTFTLTNPNDQKWTSVQGDGVTPRFYSGTMYIDMGTDAKYMSQTFTLLVGAELDNPGAQVNGIYTTNASAGIEYRWYASVQGFLSSQTLQLGQSNTALTANKFHHGGLSYNSTTGDYQFYLDGNKDGNGTNIQGFNLSNTAIGAGHWPAAEKFYDGNIGYFLKYNRVLSPHEVRIISRNPYSLLVFPDKIMGNLNAGSYFQTLTELTSINDTLTKQVAKLFAENNLMGNILVKSVSKNNTEIQNFTDSLIRSVLKRLNESINNSDTLTTIRIFLKNLVETVTNTDSLVKSVNKILSEARSIVDTLTKSVTKRLTDAVTNSDVLTTIRVFLKTLTETVTSSDSLVKSVTKTFSEIQSYVDSLVKQITKTFTESAVYTDIVTSIRVFLKTLSEVVSVTDSLVKKIYKTFVESNLFVDLLNVFSASMAGFSKIKSYILKQVFKNSIGLKDTKKNNTLRLPK